MNRSHRAMVLLASAMALAGCQRGPERKEAARAATTGAELGSSSNDEAVMRVATARCQRELACNKIGQGRAHEDLPTCLDRMGLLMDEEAGRSTCPGGVDELAVSTCLFDIQRTPCGGELETRTNLPSCTKSVLCLR